MARDIPPVQHLLVSALSNTRNPADITSLDPQSVTAFVNADRYRVEFLTPNTGRDEHLWKAATMPALGGDSATPLRFLDYPIKDPVWSVLLHRGASPSAFPIPHDMPCTG